MEGTKGLSPETTYFRFFSVHPWLSDKEVHHFTHVDHSAREAIVASAGDEIVAVARFDRLMDPLEAEVAFVVAEVGKIWDSVRPCSADWPIELVS